MKFFSKCKFFQRTLFLLGFVFLFLSYIPMILLGQDSFVYYHDQLDGELIAYIYQAKYLFSGSNIIPEFMNGTAKTALIAPAPFAVLLFRLFSPFVSYMILLILGQACAYSGMFLLVHKIISNHYIAFVSAILFAFLPLLPVYGLAQYGVPLLLYCFWLLYEKNKIVPSLIYIGFYTVLSSPVLIGFVWISCGFLLACFFLWKKRISEQKWLLLSFVEMFILYVLSNLNLFLQLLGINNSYISHKAEYVLTPRSFLEQAFSSLTSNTSHSTDYHVIILILTIITLLTVLFLHKKLEPQTLKCAKHLAFLLALICVLCFAAALWETSFVIGIRGHFGALKSFQFARILWITPTLWYIALALCLNVFMHEKLLLRGLHHGISLIFLLVLAFCCLKGSFAKPNLHKLLNSDYKFISWSDYYALGVMEQVENFIYTEEHLQKSEYTVVSLGIDPAAALYHGFYCIDGYSNNYDLEHKHAFRKIIAPELAQNDHLKDSYDGWGNRCYLFSSEIPGYYHIEKNSFWYNHLQIDTGALSDMDCDYILSAAYIVNAEELNLSLLREQPFNTANSYYQIYLYKVNP